MDVSGGLSPVIIFLKKIASSGNNVVILGSSGKMQEIYGYLEVISQAPHTLWGVNQGTTLYYGNACFCLIFYYYLLPISSLQLSQALLCTVLG